MAVRFSNRATVCGSILGAALGLVSFIGVNTTDLSETTTAAGWVILGGLAVCIGSGVGAVLSLATTTLALSLSRRTDSWLQVVATVSGIGAAALVSLNFFGLSTAAVVVIALGAFLTAYMTTVVALAQTVGAEQDTLMFRRRDVFAAAGGASTACLGVGLLHATIGDGGLAFSPAALVVYAVLLGVPLIALFAMAGVGATFLRPKER